MVARKLLEKLGCSVVIATNGLIATKTVAQSSFDLILMDCMMPGLDGYEATQSIRESGQFYARIPIIACTANTSDSDRHACQQAGMDDFIEKPLSLAKVSDLLQRWSEKIND